MCYQLPACVCVCTHLRFEGDPTKRIDLLHTLRQMAACGAYEKRKAMFLLSTPAVDVLVSTGWLHSHEMEFYTLTPKCSKHLVPVLRYERCVPLPCYSACQDPSRMTVPEMIGRLANEGWTDEQCSLAKSKQMPAYSLGSRRVWYCAPDKVPHASYLMALMAADKILETTADAIFHGQLKAYLVCFEVDLQSLYL